MATPLSLWPLYLSVTLLSFPSCMTNPWTSASAKPVVAADTHGNDTDWHSLLTFKAGIVGDPNGALNLWNSSLHFCLWRGVQCGHRHSTRVVGLYLGSLGLFGSISPSLANLSFLRELHLYNNSLYGIIPWNFGHLIRLQRLDLSFNTLSGGIPGNLTRCLHLRKIYLSHNRLTGEIPTWFTSLPQLRLLNLMDNRLHGAIPPSLQNLSSRFLLALAIGQNMLTGTIPEGLGRLDGLMIFDVSDNQLSGSVPAALYNKSSLVYLGFGHNQLSGTLPPEMGLSLPKLSYLTVYETQFYGLIPNSLSNCSLLKQLEMGENGFQGTIPANLGSLKELRELDLFMNRLQAKDPADWDFLTSLTNCTRLEELILDRNLLEGVLPNSVANLSTTLTALMMSGNWISGSIPAELENLVNLRMLNMAENRFTGSIPSSLGKLKNLGRLLLSRNLLSGEIPSALGNLTRLSELYLMQNQLSGSIPTSFGHLQQLQFLNLSLNYLRGPIPSELLSLTSLTTYVDLSKNSLEGAIPTSVGSMRSLGKLYLSNNRLSGEIPSALGDCQSLEVLALNHNFFQGVIPPSLGNLQALQSLDLSHNNLSGRIPSSLGDLKSLRYLNLSFNNFQGEVPKKGVFTHSSAVSLVGNGKLCGGASSLRLPACPIENHGKMGLSHLFKVMIPIAIAGSCLLVVVLCLIAYVRGKKRSETRPTATTSWEDKYERISYNELLKATDGFSSTNLVGMGSFGSVYKGSLDGDQRIVAVKVLNLQHRGAPKSFMAECEALKGVRHRNLVKIISACSSVDFRGNDFKALVYEFMPNGSLEMWLHPALDAHGALIGTLGFARRLSIASDVASALEYLHKHCSSPVVHCDLKPSNVLLDKDMNARVSDFGLARILCESGSTGSQNPTSSVGIKGSIGYVAPEYGLGVRVSTQGDVYSFGVLLMEMFTAKKPVDDMFKEGLSLRKFVEMAVPEQLMEIVDPGLLSQEEAAEELPGQCDRRRGSFKGRRMQECLVSIMGISLICTKESPIERMEMGDVVRELHKIKDKYAGTTAGVAR